MTDALAYVNEDVTFEVIENDYSVNSNSTPGWKQSIATTASALITLSAGFTQGYGAILISQLRNHETIHLDWNIYFGLIPPLGMFLGCVVAGFLTDGLGRRNSHIFFSALISVGWLLITFAASTNQLYAGRFISVLCTGAVQPLAVVYLGEIAAPQYRGHFLFISYVSINLGVTLGSKLVGQYLSWNITAAICAAPPLLAFLIMTRLPESPTWLMHKGKINEAKKAFVWYRGNSESAQKELASIIEKQTAKIANFTFVKKVKIVFSAEFLTPFFISCVLFVTVQFCGAEIILVYATDILNNTMEYENYLDSIRTIGLIILVIFAKFIPRKQTFVICSIGTSIMTYLLAVYLYINPKGWEWIPLCFMVLYSVLSSVINTLLWSFVAEIFPARIRGFGSGISASTSYVFSFIFHIIAILCAVMNLGQTVLFTIFATITFICGMSLHFLLPETQKKTLQEIEDD